MWACDSEPASKAPADTQTEDEPEEEEEEEEEEPMVDEDGDGHAPLSEGGDDCDDADPDLHPGAPERCDGQDNDCDDVLDPEVFFVSEAGVTTAFDPADMADVASPAHLLLEEAGELTFCAPGTYAVQVEFAAGGDSSVVGQGVDQTVLDGGAGGTVIRAQGRSGQSLTIQDLTVQNGDAGDGDGGGIWFNQGTLLVERVAVVGNAATRGAGVFIGAGTELATITDAQITDIIDASEGGGLYLAGGEGQLFNVAFSGNSARRSGGGLYLAEGGDLDLQDASFVGNSSSNEGGAAFVGVEAQMIAVGVELRDNSAGYGGGVYIDDSGYAVLRDATLSGNVGSGALANLWNSRLSVVGTSTISDHGQTAIVGRSEGRSHFSDVRLSGVTATGNSGVVVSGQYTDIEVEDSTLSNGGGAIGMSIGELTVTDSELSNHTGSAVAVGNCHCTFERVTFTGNTTSGGGGGGIYHNGNWSTGTYISGTDTVFSDNAPDDIYIHPYHPSIDPVSRVMGDDTSFWYGL